MTAQMPGTLSADREAQIEALLRDMALDEKVELLAGPTFWTTAPIERLLLRNEAISQVAVYGVPDPLVGDQVMAAVVLREGARLDPEGFGRFLAEQPDLSPKAWPRFVRIAAALPRTATNKVLKRELAAEGVATTDVVWTRGERDRRYRRPGSLTP